MTEVLPEIIEQILIRLDVRDLIRFRSVSKSWKYLISSSEFIKAHLEHSYRRENENDTIRNKRIVMSATPHCNWDRLYDADNFYFVRRTRRLLGSCNGLICFSPSHTEFSLVNPETREVNKLKKPEIPKTGYLIYGFGYDSSADDYKVVVGFPKGNNLTCFLMFTLKSNIWEVVGEVKYTFITRVGVIYRGALHWVAYHGSPHNKQHVIISFDLSEDKFEEIPQHSQCATRLGTLCVFYGQISPLRISVMNDYNVRLSWELVGPDRKINTNVINQLKELKYYIPSLVSPYVCKEPNKKRQEISTTKSHKVPKLSLVPATSSEVGNRES